MKTKILLKKWKILVSNINYISERQRLLSVFFLFKQFVCQDTDDATSAQLQRKKKESYS